MTFLAVVATWALGAGVRKSFGDRQLTFDCCIFGAAAAWLMKGELVDLLRKIWETSPATVGSSLVLAVIAASFPILGFTTQRESSKITNEEALPEDIRKWTLQHPKTKIFPCQTKHARMFPARHAFEYSYLQCGFPIIPGGVISGGCDVSTGKDRELGSWWLRVRAADYLTRGNGMMGFYGKLQMFLRQQKVDDNDWSYAYLVTAPRFFGYSFNPVSFWYIYDQEHQLKKMILEVNNTFGERRIYLLNGTSPSSPPQIPGSVHGDTGSNASVGTKLRFTDLWMKDFHVSPFNSRKGSYALKAHNPFPHPGYANPMIDNTITLKSSKDHAKVVARLYCVGTPLDPEHFGLLGALWFILRWWWVGLVTFPRILKEAFNLFYKRSLHVWFRPEVLTPSLGRMPTESEITIHKVLFDYLVHLLNIAQDDFRIVFYSAIPESPKQSICFTRAPRGGAVKEFEIRVLTPAFYSRFVHYGYTSEAFDRECIFTDEKNRTCWTSHPALLVQLLSQSASVAPQSTTSINQLAEYRWLLLKRLRCAPAEPAYNATPKSCEFRLEDIRTVKYSEMDVFVRNQQEWKQASGYRRTVTKLFLAQRFCFGFPQMITLQDCILRIFLCYLAAQELSRSSDPARNAFGTWPIVGGFVAATASHVYGLCKGFQ